MPKSKNWQTRLIFSFYRDFLKDKKHLTICFCPLFCHTQAHRVTPNCVWAFLSLYSPGFARDLLVPSKPWSSRSRSRECSLGQRQRTEQRFQACTRCTGDQRHFPGGHKKPNRGTLEFRCQLQERWFFLEEKSYCYVNYIFFFPAPIWKMGAQSRRSCSVFQEQTSPFWGNPYYSFLYLLFLFLYENVNSSFTIHEL